MLDDALKNTFPASDPVSIVISEEKRMRPESASGTHRPGSYAGRSTLGHRSADTVGVPAPIESGPVPAVEIEAIIPSAEDELRLLD